MSAVKTSSKAPRVIASAIAFTLVAVTAAYVHKSPTNASSKLSGRSPASIAKASMSASKSHAHAGVEGKATSLLGSSIRILDDHSMEFIVTAQEDLSDVVVKWKTFEGLTVNVPQEMHIGPMAAGESRTIPASFAEQPSGQKKIVFITQDLAQQMGSTAVFDFDYERANAPAPAKSSGLMKAQSESSAKPAKKIFQ